MTRLPVSLVFAILIAFLFPFFAVAESWPQHRGPNRSGLTSEESGWRGTEWPIGKLWQTTVGMGCTSPLLVDGKIYVMGWEKTGDNPRDRRNPLGKDVVTCLDANTGEVIWQHSYEQTRYVRFHSYDEGSYGGPSSTPTFDRESEFLYTHGLDGDFRCLKDGEVIWQMNIYDHYDLPRNPRTYPGTNASDHGCNSSPLLFKDWVIIDVGAPKHGTVIAFDKRTGEEAWTSELKTWAGQTPGPQFITVEGVPCLATLTLEYLVIMRLDPGNEGRTVAQFPWKAGWNQNLAMPAIDGNHVLLTGYHWINGGRDKGASAVFEVSLDGIRQLWKSLPCSKANGGSFYRGTAYIGSDNLHCLEMKTGKPIWKDPDITGDDFGMGASVIITGDEKLIYLGEKNVLYLAEIGRPGEPYQRLAKIENVLDPFKGHSWPHVALAEGRLLVKDKFGNLACLAVDGSAPRMSLSPKSAITQAPTPRPALPTPDRTEATQASDPEAGKHWPRFRGAGGSGIATPGRYPTEWDEATGQNIAWKVPVPLPGASSPVVWGNRLFLTGGSKTSREVYGFDTKTGELLWATAVLLKDSQEQDEEWEGQTWASPTPVTDGRHVFAIFGNGDLAALDFDGKIAWSRNLEKPIAGFGYSTSLTLNGDHLIIQLSQGLEGEDDSRLMAVDKATGKPVWEVNGEDYPVSDSWSSPLVARTAAGDQLITRGGGWLIASDPASGKTLWKQESEPGDVSTSPVFANGLIISSGYGHRTEAFRPDGKRAWISEVNPPEVASPLAHDGLLYTLRCYDSILTVLDLRSGDTVLEHEFASDTGDGAFYASPVAAGENIYAFREDGAAVVFRVERDHEGNGKFQSIGLGSLVGQRNCWATPAFANRSIYLRSDTHLYALQSAAKKWEALWTFSEGVGTTTTDAGSDKMVAAIHGADWVSGGGLRFDGRGHLAVPDAALAPGFPSRSDGSGEDFTIAATIVFESNGDRHPIAGKQGNELRGFLFEVDEQNRLAIQLFRDQGKVTKLHSPEKLKPGHPVHVAVAYDYHDDGGSDLALFVDGERVASTNKAVGPASANPVAFDIGRYAWSGNYRKYFRGRIDDIFVKNEALSTEAIQKLWNNRESK